MIQFTDIHGNFDTFLALLAIIPPEEVAKGIVISGDLIDRGPKSMQMVQYCIDNNIPCTMGNHELMMIDWIASGCSFNDMLWLGNGGMEALESYKEVDPNEILKGEVDRVKLLEHAKWMQDLPTYLEFPDIKNEEGRYLVVSHSNIANAWDLRKAHDHKTVEQFKLHVLWGRPAKIKDVPEIYNIIGHTPQQDGARIRKSYANIDTGCFYKGEGGYHKLTAIQFPEMIVYEHENIDGDNFKENPMKLITNPQEIKLRKKNARRR